MKVHQFRKRIIASLCLLALGGLFAGLTLAGKPGGGGGPVPPGTIYFYGADDAMRMNGDGSGKTYANPGVPSYQRHAGSRWFMVGDYDYDAPYDPDTGYPIEVFAVNESYQSIQLTGDPNIKWTMDTPAWGKDDSFFSFTGMMITAEGVIGGLFVADLDWSSGSPVAGSPTLVLQAETLWEPWWYYPSVNLGLGDWSPAGNQVAFNSADEAGVVQLYVASFSDTGVATSLLTTGGKPAWSPDGGRIAFDRGEIWTIKPDGTSALRLTQSSHSSREDRNQYHPTWSPDGAYIAFTHILTKWANGAESRSVQRIPAGGGSTLNLTSDLKHASGPMWRP